MTRLTPAQRQLLDNNPGIRRTFRQLSKAHGVEVGFNYLRSQARLPENIGKEVEPVAEFEYWEVEAHENDKTPLETKRKIVHLYQDGYGPTAIASMLGVPYKQARSATKQWRERLQRMGLDFQSHRAKPKNIQAYSRPPEYHSVANMYRAGSKPKAIAQSLKVPYEKVLDICAAERRARSKENRAAS